MPVQVPLTQGKFAIIDKEDAALVMQYRWKVLRNGRHRTIYYAVRSKPPYRMHHLILPKKDGFDVDHVDGDGLNNTRTNLRYATRTQNLANQRKASKGVIYRKNKRKWEAHIMYRKKWIYLGLHETEDGAKKAYNNKALELYGDFAHLNEVAA